MDIIGGAGWFKTTAQVNEKPVINFHCRNKQFQTLPQQKTLKTSPEVSSAIYHTTCSRNAVEGKRDFRI